MWRDLSMIWMSRGLHQRRPICRKDAGVAPSRYQCFYVTLFLNDGLQEGGSQFVLQYSQLVPRAM